MAALRLLAVALVCANAVLVAALVGDVLIPEKLGSVFGVVTAPKYAGFDGGMHMIDAANVEDIVAATVGLQASEPAVVDGLPNGDVFRKPRAVATVIVDGLSAAAAPAGQFSTSYFVRDVPPQFANALRTVLDGAFVDDSDVSISVADMAASVFAGRSLTLAFSASRTAAMLAHVKRAAGDLDFAVAMDMSAASFGLVSGKAGDVSDSLALSSDRLRSLVAKEFGVASGSSSVVLSAGGVAAEFSLDDATEFMFLAELAAARAMGDALAATGKRDVPDVLTFSLIGYKAVERAVGADSVKARVAAAITVDRASKILAALSDIYGGDFVGFVALLNTDQLEVAAAAESAVRDVRDANNGTVVVRKNPPIPFAVTFNIVLWLSIALVLALIAVSYSLMYMDPGHDSVIYLMTSQRPKSD